MLSKINRLRKQKDFDHAFKTGRSSFNDILGIKVAKNDLAEQRIGIVINNKVSKKAVIRNRVRRRIREIIRLLLPNLQSGLDFLIICSPIIKDKTYQEIEAAIVSNLKRLRVLK